MTSTQPNPNHTLIALALLSILFGMVMFDVMFLVDQLPAWMLLPGLFSAGVMVKFIDLLHQKSAGSQAIPRIVTVEFEWPVLRKEVINGSYL